MPLARWQANGVVARRESAVARYCAHEAEEELIDSGWGGWLVRQGYAVDERERARLSRANSFVEGLPQRAELMGERPIGWAEAEGACPRRSEWSRAVEATSVWQYSLLRVNRTEGAPHAINVESISGIGWADVEAQFSTAFQLLRLYALENLLVPVLLAMPQMVLPCIGVLLAAILCAGNQHQRRQAEQRRVRISLHKKSDEIGTV